MDRLPDGSLCTENGFDTREQADNRVRDVESDQRRGRFVDPRPARTRFGDRVCEWVQAHDVSAVTWATHDSHLHNHILPRFTDTELRELSRILAEAVDEGLIGSNPCRKLRLATGDQPARPARRHRQRINPEMHFHDLRHTHKTWLIEDGVPEVLQHKRIDHKFRGVMGVCSHVTQPMPAGPQARWEQAGSTAS
ncbi:hypothetical protein [Saccharothrix xinjiangensis]|uniref:Phage integrase family protein n=1 Tax=Saccharothrix xinjiangensis TaxID=204798 RepID=A0ABV9XYQ1_9PSEU